MTRRRDFDVVVAGGGMVGAAFAVALACAPATGALRIAIVEPRPARVPRSDEPLEIRVSALSHAAVRLLHAVGAWPRLAERRPCAYERMIVWDAGASVDGPQTLVFDAAEAGEADLGWIAENRAVTAALLERALAAGAVLLAGPIEGVELGADHASVACGAQRLTTGLIVAADGADSRLRGWAGIGGSGAPYPQSALVAHLEPARSHGAAARQRFLADGPLALLPLSDGRVSLVWSLPPERALELSALEPAAFAEAVTAASDRVLGALTLASARQAFPLRRFNAARYAIARLALIGDAAHSVHPLAGQGVNQGLLDASALAAEIGRAVAAGEDPGDRRVLERYGRARRAENALVGVALDGLWRLFGDRREAVAAIRRTGLGLVNRSTLAKQFFVRRALGS